MTNMESTKSWKRRLVPLIGIATASVVVGTRLIGGGTKFEILCGIFIVAGSTLIMGACGFEVMSRLRKDRAK
jgi:hypothetical protein